MELFASLLLVASTIIHDVSSSKLVKGGEIHITVNDASDDHVTLTLDYDIKMKWYAPVKDQKGTLSDEFPADFVTEQGYLDLEKTGTRVFRNVTLTYLGRRACLQYPECHNIKIQHNDGKWDALVDYNPAIASTGWATLELTYYDIPVLGSQTVKSHLRP